MSQGEGKSGCCGAARSDQPEGDRDIIFLTRANAVERAPDEVTAELRANLLAISGGFFDMGARRSTFPADQDNPRRKIKLSPYLMSPVAVSNDDYARFVAATGYQTVAETEGWSYVFHLLLANPGAYPVTPPGLPWWRKVDGACWSAPEGPGSDVADRGNHPAVHICWYDALAYCNWSGLELPSEAQWECAARGGLSKRKFPWGDEMQPEGQFAMNTFQGNFPSHNSGEDGWIGTAPVDAFAPNGFGMFNMTGNVWEWVAERFGPLPGGGRVPSLDPLGQGDDYARVQRGGSYLCHVSYCDRYHVHSRTRNDPDSSTGNCGFRVAGRIL